MSASYSGTTTRCPDGTFYGAVMNAAQIVVAMSEPLPTRARARGWNVRKMRQLVENA